MSNPMSPAASPGQMPRGGVHRVNNVPIYLIGAVAAIFLGIMGLVAMDRAGGNKATSESVKRSGHNTLLAKELAEDRPDGIITASVSYSGPPDFPVENLNLPPLPLAIAASSQHQADMERVRQMKLQQFRKH